MEKLKVIRAKDFYNLIKDDYFNKEDYKGKVIEVVKPGDDQRYYFNCNIKKGWCNYWEDDGLFKKLGVNIEELRKEHENEESDGLILRFITPSPCDDPLLNQCSIQTSAFKNNKMIDLDDYSLIDYLLLILFGFDKNRGYNVIQFTVGPLLYDDYDKFLKVYKKEENVDPDNCFVIYRFISQEDFEKQVNEWRNNTGKFLTSGISDRFDNLYERLSKKEITFDKFKNIIENE